MSCAQYKSAIGVIEIEANEKSIVRIGFVDDCSGFNAGVPSRLTDLAFSQICEYFERKRFSFDVPICPQGTDFQLKVWEQLCKIPYGQTRSYGQIAAQVGNPKASRAVGMANNKNPIAIIIPCHRVVGANGSLVGYAAGLDIKRFLLDIESNAMCMG